MLGTWAGKSRTWASSLHGELFATVLMVALVLGGCGRGMGPTGQTTILLWYDWQGADEVVLKQLLDNFREVEPSIHVIANPIPKGLTAEFARRFDEGLEPDVILTRALNAQELIRAGYIRDLTPYDLDTRNFSAAALSTVQSTGKAGGQLYGLPFALSTQLLFYNQAKVPTPPATLSELVSLTSDPAIVMGLNTGFADSMWGIGAFGGRAYDDEGQIKIDRGALTNWLSTLARIQGAAGFALSGDQALLRKQFIAGKTSLLVDDAQQAPTFSAAMTGTLGIAALPEGGNGNAATPVMAVTSLLISDNTGDAETQAALTLMQFLTNSQQQAFLEVSDIGQLAATNWAPVTANMPPVVVALSEQIGSAVPIALDQRPIWDELAAHGQTLYRSVLEGQVDEQEGAGQLEAYFAQLQDVQPTPTPVPCAAIQSTQPITLTVWHDWSAAESKVLDELAAEFHATCPQVTVAAQGFDSDVTMDSTYREDVAQGNPPDMLVTYSTYIGLLAGDDLIRSINGEVDPAELSAFVPSAVEAMRYNGRLYGFPESVSNVALIYNPKLVPEPPRTLNALLLSVDGSKGFAMPATFYDAFWGLHAFNVELLDANGRIDPENAEAVAWLEWLRDAANRPGFELTDSLAEAEQRFVDREAAFLVSGPWALTQLRAELPDDEIAVTTLPGGAVNLAAPLVDVTGFVFPTTIDDATLQAGLAFARLVSSRASEQKLLQTGVHVPANITVDVSQHAAINGFLDQAQWAQGNVQGDQWKEIFAHGDDLYRQVLQEGEEPAAAWKQFAVAVNEANTGP